MYSRIHHIKKWQRRGIGKGNLEGTFGKTYEEARESFPKNKAGSQVWREIARGKLYTMLRKNPQYLGMKKSLMTLSHFVKAVSIGYFINLSVC